MSPAPRKPKRVTLADLSDEDRIDLLEQAREAARFNPTDVDGYAELSDREKAVRGLMDARDHARGCPVQEGTELGRIEGYDAFKPANPNTGEPARTVTVIRCIECAGSTVLDNRLGGIEATLAAREAELVTVAAGDDDGPDDDETP